VIDRSKCLSTVFDDPEIMFFSDGHNGIHIRGMAEQMNRDNGFRPRGYLAFDLTPIHVERDGLNIHKNRPGFQKSDDLCRCDKGKGRGNDLVTGFNAAGPQSQKQGIRSVGHAHRLGRTVIGGDFFFQRGHVGPENKAGIFQNIADGGINVPFEAVVLSF